jgi:hypothetical protein
MVLKRRVSTRIGGGYLEIHQATDIISHRVHFGIVNLLKQITSRTHRAIETFLVVLLRRIFEICFHRSVLFYQGEFRIFFCAADYCR